MARHIIIIIIILYYAKNAAHITHTQQTFLLSAQRKNLQNCLKTIGKEHVRCPYLFEVDI